MATVVVREEGCDPQRVTARSKGYWQAGTSGGVAQVPFGQ
jgi:hypothetical protein